MTSSNTNFNPEQLASYVMGELDAATAGQVEALLARSAEAQRLTATMRLALSAMKTDDSVLPPLALVERVKTLTRPAERPSLAQWLSNLGESVAGLVFDSRAQVALAGFRGSSAAEAQLAFSSDACEVDLQLTPPETAADQTWLLRGQLSTIDGAEIPHAAIALIDRATRQIHASTDSTRTGEFNLQSQPGTYDLAIKVGDKFVTIPEILVG